MTTTAIAAGGLVRYVTAATLARLVDGGGVVAVVLLVTAAGGPGWEAGALGACITFPHLLGPLIARRLDVAADGRRVLAVACVVHGGGLAGAVLVYPLAGAVAAGVLLIICGLVGPLLTGGISSRLPAIAGPSRTAQRRAQGWDVATYGIGGTIGPSLVAAVSAWTTPTVAALVLSAATCVAAVVVRLLPPTPGPGSADDVPHTFRTFAIIISAGPLRRTLYQTVVVSAAVSVLPVTAVASTAQFGVSAAVAGALTAAFGLGGLAGSAIMMIRPLTGDPDRAMPVLAAAIATALIVVAVMPGPWTAGAAFALVGILNSAFFAATLAARSEYAPDAARAQVFVWVGALKITAGSTGTAAAGALVARGAQLPVLLGVGAIVSAVAAAIIDRALRPPAAVGTKMGR